MNANDNNKTEAPLNATYWKIYRLPGLLYLVVNFYCIK